MHSSQEYMLGKFALGHSGQKLKLLSVHNLDNTAKDLEDLISIETLMA
ncbi:hypothetical protein DFP94_103124 [Fontibacillus phaseoli]|uniref:Uncharacterized protein n=1 Tax=Fontibacillus phaseoli TaxID=1416533 RepID=A0A369BFS3_9BACL|nr:hypothetical protein DFP94_103124 [Fontibacillus phaseoli]